MSKKVVKKKKSKLIKTRLFTVLFAVMFIVSLFTGIKAFAETGPFKLNSATISDKASGVTGSISSFNDSEVINDVTFHKLDDYATFKFELKSNLNREITILEITDDNSNSYIAYEYDKHENEKLASNGTLNFIVKAVYKTELTDTSKRNQTNNVKFTIKYLDNGEEKSDEIIVNPKTGDGISKSIVMLIISSVGLVTCITLDKKRKSKKLSKLSVLILTGLVLSPIVVKAAKFAYELTLKSTIGLYDKVVVTIDDKVNEPTTQTIDYNTKLDSLPSPSKEGYTLTNWTVNNEEFDITKEITNDITIEANYRKNNYTITFNSNVPVGGTLDPATSMADMDMKYDEEKNLLPNGYLVTGYLFDSWNTMPDGSGTKYEDMDSVKNLTSTDGETVNLYARWGATPYTVIFDKNSTEATGTMENISKAYNETFNLPENTYERTDYSFTGWNTSPMGDGTHYDNKQSVKNLDIDGEVTLYAEWSPALITISFDINTDDPEATGTMVGQIVVYDVRNIINENKFTRTGYAFDSWNTEPDGSGTKYDDKADITNAFLDNTTLYAQWAVTPYTVIFNKNSDEATGSMNNQEIAYGQKVALTKNTYTREHYKFMGWNTQADGQGTHYEDEQEVKNLDIDGEVNLYAEWKESTSLLEKGTDVKSALTRIDSTNAISFKKYPGVPNLEEIDNKVTLSTTYSNFPTYAWNDNGTIYWWSEADTVYMNSDSSYFFEDLTNLQSLDVTGLNTSRVTNMSYMFHRCFKIQSLNLSTFDTSNVINMNGMFMRCRALTNLNISSFDTSRVTNMGNMFNQDYGFTTINLSHFNTSNVRDMNHMFCGTTSLDEVNITSFDTRNVTDMSYMFQGSAIKTIDLSSFYNVNANIVGMFNQAENVITIYVGEQWTTTKLSEINANNIIGGAGTVYSVADKNNARLDDPDNGSPGYFTLKGHRYIRYNKNGADGTETMASHYLTNTGSLKANTFTNTGKTFAGWNTKADGSGTSYTDGQLMSDLTESKTPLTLYAQWE